MYIYIDGADPIDVNIDSRSYRYRKIKGEDALTVYFSTQEFVDIPVGAYMIYMGERYTLMTPAALTMVHTQRYEYTLVLKAASAELGRYYFRDTSSGRLSFSLTATADEHLDMLIANLNAKSSGWTKGVVLDSTQIVINYNYNTCEEALSAIAEAFATEWEINGKTISLHRVEYNKDNALPLSYGRGNGFLSGVRRDSQSAPVETLVLQTSDRNIDYSKYGAKTLLLPPAGSKLTVQGREYVVLADRLSIERVGVAHKTNTEACLDATDIYPSGLHIIETVDADDPTSFTVAALPDVDYSDCRIAGEVMYIVFQSGELAGRQFDIVQTSAALSGYNYATRSFRIVTTDEEGVTLPNDVLRPAVGDTFRVFACALPNEYICDDANQTGASWELFQRAAERLHDEEDQKFSFAGDVDPIWSAANWASVGGRMVLGGYVSFTDARWQQTALSVRIIGIKDYLLNPYAPELELSNDEVSSGVSSVIRQLESQEVAIRDSKAASVAFSKRRWQDAQRTAEMLEGAIAGFSSSIKPSSVQTLYALIGDESTQFEFVNESGAGVTPALEWDSVAKTVSISSPAVTLYMHHLTFGSRTMSTDVDGRYYWQLAEFVSGRLEDASTPYYIYLRCSRSVETRTVDGKETYWGSGEFRLETQAHGIYDDADYYWFLMGVVLDETDGYRSVQTVYGFSEISGGRITTDVIQSADGETYLRLTDGTFSWADGKLVWDGERLLIKGSVMQDASGNDVTVVNYRGAYDSKATYSINDVVSYTSGGKTQLFIFKYATPVSGKYPYNSTYWRVYVSSGTDGTDGTDGKDGKDGTNGTDGNGIASTAVAYGKSSSESVMPASWEAQQGSVALSQGDWLWVRTTIKYTDTSVSDTVYYSKAYVGTNGTNGTNGKDGRGIVSAVAEYAVTEDQSTEGATWYSDLGAIAQTAGWYLWTRLTINYTSGSPTVTYQMFQIPSDGASSVITSVEVHYGESASASVKPTVWVADAGSVNPVAGHWLWTRVTTHYSDRSDVVTYSKARQGSNGASPVYRGEWDASTVYYGNAVRADVVRGSDGAYYILSTAAGEVSGAAHDPTTDKTSWIGFGAQFSSVATALLLAETAYVDNLGVRMLQTSPAKTAGATDYEGRITAEKNVLTMEDDEGNVKLVVAGKDLSNATGTTTFATRFNTKLLDSVVLPDTANYVIDGDTTSFNVENSANVVNVSSMTVPLRLEASLGGSRSGQASAVWMVDGAEISTAAYALFNVPEGSSWSDSLDLPSFQTTLAKGTHTIRVQIRIAAMGGDASTLMDITAGGASSATSLIVYKTQLVEIAKNGIRAMFASNYLASFKKTGTADSTVELMMLAGSYGVKVTDSSVKLKLGGNWYKATAKYASGAYTMGLTLDSSDNT